MYVVHDVHSLGTGGSYYINVLNTTSNLWRARFLGAGQFPASLRFTAVQAFPSGEAIMFVGEVTGSSSRADIYNISSNVWSQSPGGLSTPRMFTHQEYGSVGNFLIFAGGTTFSKAVDMYNTKTAVWNSTQLSIGRETCTVATIPSRGLFFCIGGRWKADWLNRGTRKVYIFDANSGLWRSQDGPPQLDTFIAQSAVSVGGRYVFVTGGNSHGQFSNAVLKYDVDSDSWQTLTTTLGQSRSFHSAVEISGLVFVLGGLITGALP